MATVQLVHLDAASTASEPEEDRRGQSLKLLAQLHALPEGSDERRRVRDRLVELHQPLVAYIARRFSGRSEPVDDLAQVGNIGLIKAIERFDCTRGLAFTTFATPTIVGEIKRYFRDSCWMVRVPRRAQELQTAIACARDELGHDLGRAPTAHELAAHLRQPLDAVIEAIDVARSYSASPLDALTESGGRSSEHPALGDIDRSLDGVEDREVLRPLLAGLPAVEREVLALRFFGDMTQLEIAGVIGVSQMQVSRLMARALTQLRNAAGVPAATI